MFEVTQQGTVSVISGTVPLIKENLPAIKVVLSEVTKTVQPKVVLNFRDIALLDSAGLEFLWDARDQCIRQKGKLEIAEPNPLIQDILGTTDLMDQFVIFDDLLSAVGSFVT